MASNSKFAGLPFIIVSARRRSRVSALGSSFFASAHAPFFATLVTLIGIIGGCAPTSRQEAATALGFPSSIIDLGLVPPEGTIARIPMRNRLDVPIVIKTVKSSCGCTVAKAPRFIESDETSFLELRVEGRPQPARRSSRVLIQYEPSGQCAVTVNYATGLVPAFEPDQLCITKQQNGRYAGTAFLWVYAASNDWFVSVDLNRASQPKMNLVIESNPDFEEMQPGVVRIREAGMHIVRCRVELPKAGSVPGGSIPLTLSQNGSSQQMMLPVVFRSDRLATARPEQVMIATKGRDEMVGNSRVFLLMLRATADCVVSYAPDFIATRLTRISEKTWRLDATVRSSVPDDVDEGTIEIQVRKEDQVDEVSVRIQFRVVERGAMQRTPNRVEGEFACRTLCPV